MKILLILLLINLYSCAPASEPEVLYKVTCIKMKPNLPYAGGNICKEEIGDTISCHRGWGRAGWLVPCEIYDAASKELTKLKRY